MKYFIVIACSLAALQAVSAEQDFKSMLDDIHRSFEQMGKTAMDNVDTEGIKESLTKNIEKMKDQMSHLSDDLNKYISEHQDSPVAQAAGKMRDLVKDFNEKNPSVEANLKNVQHQLSEAGEKFTQQWKEVVDKMNADGGLKDQLTNTMQNWGEKIKETAGELETKFKEMVDKH